ncbi:hypothetical protein [Prochlorococcus sp. MIT 0801]|uniref:hypothetical protein n=1 Tax=Prochlorococcus sp. MIT 0801 TaxID=1501269 RepID=UPI0004F6A7F2|nr:hypothetical protein [Prochlorococcus sp. MIT 0801]AIQ97599.1 hypothetical protein EW15_1507 [Prochlorococcus sp. MIT 0801]
MAKIRFLISSTPTFGYQKEFTLFPSKNKRSGEAEVLPVNQVKVTDFRVSGLGVGLAPEAGLTK